MVLSRLFHRINLSISAAVLSLATVMPGEAAAITLNFTEYAGNFGIYGGIDATLDVKVNNGQATFTFTNNSDDLAMTRIYFGQGLGSLLSGGEMVGADNAHFGSGTISDPAGGLPAWSGNFAKFGALPDKPKILFDNGLSAGETLTIVFDTTATASEIIDAILHDPGSQISARIIGQKGVQGCANNTCGIVAAPIPAAVWLMGSAFAALGIVARRKRVDEAIAA